MIESMARRLTSAELVGRTADVERVVEALASAGAGEPRHFLISGEAGVGKTRLLQATAEIAATEGVKVLTGGCVSLGDSGLPFAPYAELVSTLVAQEGSVEVARIAGRATPELARFVPALGDGAAPVPQELLAQTRLYDALLELLRRLAAQTPILVRLEDLHWADAGTLAATSLLLNSIREEPITIVATYRVDEVTRRHPLRPWLAEIGRLERIERIDLVPLSEAETAELVTNIAGATRSSAEIADIHRRSDGNPFFVEELLASTATSHGPLPATLRDVLLARVDALPPSAGELMGVAAVGGREVEHDRLTAVAGVSDSIDRDLRSLVDAGLFVTTAARDSDGYAFRHALLQEAVYDAMLPNDRRRLHGAWAQELESVGARTASALVELAHHWREARDPRALNASIAAGDAAMAGFSYEIAAHEYEGALELWDPGRGQEGGIDQAGVLTKLARAWYFAKGDRRSLTACHEAIALVDDDDGARLSGLHVLLGRVLWVAGEWGASTEAYERALELAPEEPPDTRTMALSGLGQVRMLNGEFGLSLRFVEEAAERARATGNRELEGHALNTLGVDLAGLGRVEEGTAAIDESLRIAVEEGIPDDIGRAYVNRGDILHWAGRLDDAVSSALEGVEAVAEIGLALSYGVYIRHAIVYFAFTAGRWELAREQLDEADRMLPPGQRLDQYRAVYAMQFLAASGDPEAATMWAQIRPRLEALPESEHTSQFYCGGLELAILDGRHEDALAITDDVFDILFGIDGWFRHSEVTRMAAEPTVELGLRARAAGDEAGLAAAEERLETLAAAAVRVLDVVGDAGGLLLRQLELDRLQIEAERGRLAGQSDLAAWTAVADGWDELGKAYTAIQARRRAAEAAFDGDDRDAAVALLRRVYAEASSMGATPLARHIETFARRMRVRLDAGAIAAADADGADGADFGLTKREREVLSLVALGRTNKRIAEELFISESTAGVHVSNILGKLGVSSRTEAASIALSQGLVGT